MGDVRALFSAESVTGWWEGKEKSVAEPLLGGKKKKKGRALGHPRLSTPSGISRVELEEIRQRIEEKQRED